MVARLFSKKPRSRVVAPSLQKVRWSRLLIIMLPVCLLLVVSQAHPVERKPRVNLQLSAEKIYIVWVGSIVGSLEGPGKRDIWDIALNLAPS